MKQSIPIVLASTALASCCNLPRSNASVRACRISTTTQFDHGDSDALDVDVLTLGPTVGIWKTWRSAQ